jgi:hypothetical protein
VSPLDTARLTACALIVAASAIAGCRPQIIPVTSAPPEREGTISNLGSTDDTIRLSKGVAMGLECRDGDFWLPCEAATARTGDGKIARVLPAHLDKYRSPYGNTSYYESDSSHRSVFVIVGVEAGETDLTFESGDGNRKFHVVVEP